MAIQSFSDARQQFLNSRGQSDNTPVSSGGNPVNSFQAAHDAFMQQRQSQSETQPTTTPSPVAQVVTPKTQPQNPLSAFENFVGGVYNGAVGEIGSILGKNPTPPKQPAAQKLPAGLTLNYVPTTQDNQTKALQIAAQNTGQMVNNVFHGTIQDLQKIIKDPLNINNFQQTIKNPKKAVNDLLNTIPQNINQINQFGFKTGQDIKNNAHASQTVGDALSGIAASINASFTPLTLLFKAADKIPAIGTITRLITLPLTLRGELGSNTALTLLNELPLSQQAKSNLKPGVEAIGSLVGQMMGGGDALDVPKEVKPKLTEKFGATEANTIVNQAQKIVEQRTIQPGNYTPQDIRNLVFQKKIESTPYGRQLLVSSMNADRTGTNIEIKGPEVQKAPETAITPATSLSPAHKTIETNFSNYLQNNYTDAVSKYNKLPDSQGGKIINTDIARELDPQYAQDRSLSAAVHEPASAFVKKLYADKLAEPVKDGKDLVMFTAGGTGAGKSTAIENIPAMKTMADNAKLIYDTNSNRAESAISKVQQALDTGHKVGMVYVHRGAVDAFKNTLGRAMRMGRTVPMGTHIETHMGAPGAVLQVAEHFKNNPNFELIAVDNTGARKEAKIMPVENLSNIKYNKGELQTELNKILKDKYARGEINRKVYEGTSPSFTSGEPKTLTYATREEISKQFHNAKGDNAENRPGNGAESSKPQVNTRQTPEKNPNTTYYDKAGNKIVPANKKVLTGKEVAAIRDIITARLEHIRETSSSPADFGKAIDSLVADIKEKANGDKQVLSALRTELNKEMYGIAGAGGNYKEAYATLMDIRKTDPAMGKLIDTMDNHIKELDNTLLSTPDKKYEQPAFAKERLQKQKGQLTAQEPVGEGKTKLSTHHRKVAERLAKLDPEAYNALIDKNGEIKYNVNKANRDIEKAQQLIEKEPQKAYNVAMGYENAPEGQTQNAIAATLSDRARTEKNYNVMANTERSLTLRATRQGQEIAALRGRFNDTSPHAYIQKVMDARLKRLGGTGNYTLNVDTSKGLKGLGVKEVTSAREKGMAKIDQAVQKAQTFTKKERIKIDFAQKLLDQLTCK